uniref:TIL domain-containing protein n=1 Tax=Panagrolaimus sp. PS1159 TaxID=55785 RepID=A0AC35FZX1_9BILA
MRLNFVWIFVLCIAFVNAEKCGENEKWNECATACENECGKPEAEICIHRCMPAKCQCIEKTARNNQGKCVTRSKC